MGGWGHWRPAESSHMALCPLTLFSPHTQAVNLSLQLSVSKVKLRGITSVLG